MKRATYFFEYSTIALAVILTMFALVGLARSASQGAHPAPTASLGRVATPPTDVVVLSQAVPAPPANPWVYALAFSEAIHIQTPVEQAEVAPRSPATAQPATTTVVQARTEVAQQVEQPPVKGLAAGSSPALGANSPILDAIHAAFPPSEWAEALHVATCETGGTFNTALVGSAGEQGVFQVLAKYHGPVPADIYGQAVQAARIVALYGWSPWSCR